MDQPSRVEDGSAGAARGRTLLDDYLRVLRRRGWLVALATVVALAAAAWAASQRPQLYRSSLTLQVGDPRGRMGQLGDIDVSPNMLWTDPVESEVQQLTTKAVAAFVVDTLQLRARTPGVLRDRLLEGVLIDEAAVPATYRIVVAENGSVGVHDAVGGTVRGEAGAPIRFAAGALAVRAGVEPDEYTLEVLSQYVAEAVVSGGLAASIRPETNLIDVTYTGSDQLLAPRVLDAVATAMRDLGVSRIRTWARSRTEFIGEQLDEAGAQLQAALQAVEDYKERRSLTSLSSEESRVLQRIASLQDEMEELIIQRRIHDSLVEKIETTGIRLGDIQQLAELSSQSVNSTVRFHYDQLLALLEERARQLGPGGRDPSHPGIRTLDRRIAETQEEMVSAARHAAGATDTRIAALRSALSALQQELRALPGVESDLARLQNEVDIHSDMYKFLLSRYQESQIAEAEISPYVDILDPASPARPVSGGGLINIVLAGLLGLFLGGAAAFLLEYVDRSLQSTSDVETNLGLPVLGRIPRVSQNGDRRPIPLVALTEPDGRAAESYRILRTNLAFSTAREHPLSSLVFTSPGPGEGKSTTVANLAAVLAARGDRVLLVDADLRRGEQHDIFDLMRSPGLSDLLVGQLDPREAIRPEVSPGLDVLPSGKRPPNPSELLGSRTLVDLITGWREEYRWILIDAPPVLAVSDAAVLAAVSDATVVVVRAGVTDRRAGFEAVEQLKRVDARVVGAVLNEVKRTRGGERYYAEYYATS